MSPSSLALAPASMAEPLRSLGSSVARPAATVRLLGSPGVASDLVGLMLDLRAVPVDTTMAPSAGAPEVVVLVAPASGDWDAAVASGLPVVLVSERSLNPSEVTAAVLRGANAVVHADSHPDQLLEAVRVVAGGGALLDPVQTRALAAAARARASAGNAVVALTKRERQILLSITRGDVVKQTALALGISAKTVENLQGRLFCKLGARNRAQAVARAHQLGLLPRPDHGMGRIKQL